MVTMAFEDLGDFRKPSVCQIGGASFLNQGDFLQEYIRLSKKSTQSGERSSTKMIGGRFLEVP
jgi:hypothetical protein